LRRGSRNWYEQGEGLKKFRNKKKVGKGKFRGGPPEIGRKKKKVWWVFGTSSLKDWQNWPGLESKV